MNHFAQCSPETEASFRTVLQQVFIPLALFYNELQSAVATGPSARFAGAKITADHLTFSEEDSPSWTADRQRVLNVNSLIRTPEADLKFRDAARTAQRPYFNPPDRYWGQAATEVKADLVMINGDLDPNTPLGQARK